MKHPAAVEAQLAAYERLLKLWAPRLDLISPSDLGRIRSRHIDDSLRLLSLLEGLPPGPCIDVGSGAGLPGIPLAVAGSRPWRLLEPRKKRAAFLEEVVRELDLTCEVLAIDAQTAALDPGLRGAHALAAARALAPPPQAAAHCRPLVQVGGVIAIFVGPTAEIPPEADETAPGLITIRKDDK